MSQAPQDKKTAIVVCPGRGTYNAAELGYLRKHHADKTHFLSMIDGIRATAGQAAITTLDGADRFSPSQHGRGDNASLLIYACAMADYARINRGLYDIVGVTGNSMGWYLALASGGALSVEDGGHLVNIMGGIMTAHGTGGQVVYSVVDKEWRPDADKLAAVETALTHPGIFRSIYLGGMAVLAADDAGVKHLMQTLPKDDRFPFHIRRHSAFHSPLLEHTVPLARHALSPDMFGAPKVPLIDGLGNIWPPFSTDIDALYDYTLGRQINGPYNFSKAVEVAAKEFAPDVFIILGPGTTMGAPVAQTLIAQNWENLADKTTFKARQDSRPIILSMGIPEQRALVI